MSKPLICASCGVLTMSLIANGLEAGVCRECHAGRGLMLPAVASGAPTLDVIHNCDALHLLRALPDESIDCVVTSPPYDDLRIYSGNWSFPFEPIARELYRVTKTGGVVVWVVGDATKDGCETLTSMRQALYFVDKCGFKMHDTMIYHKNANVMNNHHPRYLDSFEYMFVLSKGTPTTFHELLKPNKNVGQLTGSGKRQRTGKLQTFHNVRTPTPEYSRESNVWRIYSGGGHNDLFSSQHPAPFPEELARRHILTWTNPGDVVLDCFAGSGTTLKMARNNGRHYLGCDISQEYVNLARRRLAQPYTLPMFERLPQVAPGLVQRSLFAGVSL